MGTGLGQPHTLDVHAGTPMSVAGPKGAGQSPLFNAIAGLLPVRQGKVTLHCVDQGNGALAYVPQQESVNGRCPVTVMEVVMMGQCAELDGSGDPGREIVSLSTCGWAGYP